METSSSELLAKPDDQLKETVAESADKTGPDLNDPKPKSAKPKTTKTIFGAGDDGLPLGKRLALLRERNGWSQRELAKRSGVTNSVISTIEQGRVSPSISSLEKILSGFPVSLREFFTFDPSAEAPVFFSISEAERREFEQLHSRRLFAHQGVAVTHVVYKPGSTDSLSSSPSLYQRDGMTVGVVISGSLEVTVGGQVKVISAGEGYQFDQARPHCIRNAGNQPCEVLSVSC